MISRCVVRHKIQDQFHAPLMKPIYQLIHVFHGPELVHDVAIVRYIVAVVFIRALEARTEPYRVCSEIFYIVKFADHSLQISYAVTIAVHETARIDLIDDPFCKLFIFLAKHVSVLL